MSVFNPYLPSYEYIPDGEPHIFGERVYVYGSHDRFNGAAFCLNDYVCYSADIHDLSAWKYEGVIFRKEQDPRNQNIPADAPETPLMMGIKAESPEDLNPRGIHAMYAPDVVRGHDGRFYLYYCLDCLPEIGVAVCASPAGQYEFLGLVRHSDGAILGDKDGDLIQFDPGVFIDDDKAIYLFSGNAPIKKEQANDKQYSQVMQLHPDMLTLMVAPKKLLPSIMDSKGTGFEGHEFFEASSIRKVGEKYYFVYSSVNSHELCYAVSDCPDRGYWFGGTLVDIGDVYLDGRITKESVNCLGNTHGGIENINGTWYVFYHRQTNRTNFSRQACAEEIHFDSEGRIRQAEVTSCGLNKGPLAGKGKYPARICCHLTGVKGTTFSHPLSMKMDFPYLTQDVPDITPTQETEDKDKSEPFQYIKNMANGCTAGYKYFEFHNAKHIRVWIRGSAEGILDILDRVNGKALGSIELKSDAEHWQMLEGTVNIPDGKSALYFTFRGAGTFDFQSFSIE